MKEKKNTALLTRQDQKFSAPLLEAADMEGAIWKVALIQAGTSANNNFYPPETLRKAVSLFEGIRALARSDEDHLRDTKKDVKNIVGWFENVRFSADTDDKSVDLAEGALVGEFHISKAAEWLRVLLKDAWEQGKKDIIGFSIVAEGQGRLKKTPEGFVRVVESIDRVNSVDVVVNPAAGGRVLKLVAAREAGEGPVANPGGINNPQPVEEELQTMRKILELLESKRSDLYKKIDLENVTEDTVMELLAEALDKQPKDKPQSSDDIAEELRTLLGEGKEGKKKLAEALDLLKVQKCRLVLAETLGKTNLPEPVKNQIRSRFMDKIFDLKDLEAETIMQKETLAKLSESGRIQGLGEIRTEVGDSERDKTIKALDGFFANKDVNGIPRFKSFREAYISITGDKNLTGQLREATGLHRFTEALSSSSWAEILADSITHRMVAEYNSPGLSDWRKIVSDITFINDFRTNKRMRMGGYGTLPSVAESGTYTNLTSPGDEEATFSVSKYGGLETITMEMIANDDVGAIRRIPQKLGRAAVITLYRFIFDFIKNNPTTTYDSKALFHADHNNLGSDALAASTLQTAKIAMADKAGYGASTDILGLVPRYILVPSELEDVAFRLTTSRSYIGSVEETPRYTDTEPNIHSTYGLQVIVVPYWTDADDWALVCDPSHCPTLEIGFFQGREEPELFVQDQPTSGSMFTADKITYKIRHIYGGAILDHRGMYKAVVS